MHILSTAHALHAKRTTCSHKVADLVHSMHGTRLQPQSMHVLHPRPCQAKTLAGGCPISKPPHAQALRAAAAVPGCDGTHEAPGPPAKGAGTHPQQPPACTAYQATAQLTNHSLVREASWQTCISSTEPSPLCHADRCPYMGSAICRPVSLWANVTTQLCVQGISRIFHAACFH